MSDASTLVLALGNPLRGDDGIGPAALAALAESGCPLADVDLLDGGAPGLETALLLEGYHRVIIVDAAEMGREPGEWVRFTPGEAELRAQMGGTLHDAGLAEALALGKALGLLPDEIVIYGVQPLEIGWSQGLSAPVQAALPSVCAAILGEIDLTTEEQTTDG